MTRPDPATLAEQATLAAADIRATIEQGGGDTGALLIDAGEGLAELLDTFAVSILALEEERRVARENADGNADGWRAEAAKWRKIAEQAGVVVRSPVAPTDCERARHDFQGRFEACGPDCTAQVGDEGTSAPRIEALDILPAEDAQ